MLPLIIAFTIAVFIVALISPRLSRKVERKTVHHTTRLKKHSRALWSPLTFISHGALEVLRRLTTFSSRLGRLIHWKANGKDNKD